MTHMAGTTRTTCGRTVARNANAFGNPTATGNVGQNRHGLTSRPHS